MKNVIIEYAKISPTDLDLKIRKKVPNALCLWEDIDTKFFKFEVMGWLPMCPADIAKIKEILAPYV